MVKIVLLNVIITNKYSDDLVPWISCFCFIMMQRETMLLKLMKSFVTENTGFRFEPKHESNMKNRRGTSSWSWRDYETCLKILLKGLRESEGQTNTKCQALTHILSPMTHHNCNVTASWLNFHCCYEGNMAQEWWTLQTHPVWNLIEESTEK